MDGRKAARSLDIDRQSVEQAVTAHLVIAIIVVTVAAIGWFAYAKAATSLVVFP